MTDTQTTSAKASVMVDAPIDHAFWVFTHDMGSWWPPEHHILEGELGEMVVEPVVGGRILDRATDGTECCWARVLVYEPPLRFAFSWDISLDWAVETDLARTSEVEVRFTTEGPERTRVELEHRHLDRHGDGWQGMRDAVGSPDGWAVGLGRFAEHAHESLVKVRP
jgi:hypothetical protein